MATLLQNIQDVYLELGLPSPNAAISSSDTQTQQMVALMNRVGDTLATERDWQVLASEHRFTTEYLQFTGSIALGSQTITVPSGNVTTLDSDYMVVGNGVMQDTWVTSTTPNTISINIPATGTYTDVLFTFGRAKYDMPSNYARMVDKTTYNKSNRWSVIGPKDAQEWQWLKASYVTTGPRMRFRMMGNKFTIWPAPTSNLVMGFEYISTDWVLDYGQQFTKTKFSNDNDTSLFPDRLLILGTKLKFFEIKGFDTSTVLQDYVRELDKWKASESGADTLSLAPKYPNILLTQNNIPDTGMGNSTS
jgi:hypothetical protein